MSNFVTWNKQTFAEGWGLFDCDNGECQIQRVDDPEGVGAYYGIRVPELADDADAWALVAAGVNRGSALHLYAWGEISQGERERIIAKCGPVTPPDMEHASWLDRTIKRLQRQWSTPHDQ